MSYSEEKLTDRIIIYDEIDKCIQDSIAHVQQISNGKFILKYPPITFRKCKPILGFTGILSQSNLK